MPVLVQPSLFEGDVPSACLPLRAAVRTELAAGAWVDHLPGWVRGSTALLAELAATVPWSQPQRPMYDRWLAQPRLSAFWDASAPPAGVPEVVGALSAALSEHYDLALPSVGVNLYRDGRDSVAWHGDRPARWREEALVAVVSLGTRRRFLLRPRGGGTSVRFALGEGDLLVMGGTCQRTWQHSVPKAAGAGTRCSVTFREAAGAAGPAASTRPERVVG